MTLYSGKTEFHITDPIVRLEAKAKHTAGEEALVIITFLGKHSPEENPDGLPSAEMLEALGYLNDMASLALRSYREKFVDYQLRLAQEKRIPQADGDDGGLDDLKIDPSKVN